MKDEDRLKGRLTPLSEDRIIWREGGLLDRIAALEGGGSRVSAPATGGMPSYPPPGKPTAFMLVSQALKEDENGEKYVEVLLSWEGQADVFEIQYIETVGGG